MPYTENMENLKISARLENDEILVDMEGWRCRLKGGGDLEEIWEGLGADDPDERIPYWVELWPASLGLASWLAKARDQIRGRLCLDLGCGLGFTALAGQKLGARTVAADLEPKALELCRQNALRNQAPAPLLLAMDWRNPALKPASIERLWAGDIIYERRFIDPALDFISHALTDRGLAWVAEPGRGIFHFFLDRAREKGFDITKKFCSPAPDLHNPGGRVEVSVWELKKTPACAPRVM